MESGKIYITKYIPISMRFYLVLFCTLLMAVSCNRDKTQHRVEQVKADEEETPFEGRLKNTMDSLIKVRDKEKDFIRYDNGYEPRFYREQELLYHFMHPKVYVKWKELLENNIDYLRAGNMEWSNWLAEIDSLPLFNINASYGVRSASIYQVYEYKEDYRQVLTAINYGDSAKVISMIYICDTAINCKPVSRVERRMTKKQWDELEEKTYAAHFQSMELNEFIPMAPAEFWIVRSVTIENTGKAYGYHEVRFSPYSDGSLENVGKYLQRLTETEKPPLNVIIPHHRRHQGC